MSDEPTKVRYCSFADCKTRMSALVKDPHLLCPNHIGWQCNNELRCETCKEWSESRMAEYTKLQVGKARKKIDKEKRRARRLAANTSAVGRPAHSFSPSSVSSEDRGEIEKVYVAKNQVEQLVISDSKVLHDSLVLPSENPPQVGDSA